MGEAPFGQRVRAADHRRRAAAQVVLRLRLGQLGRGGQRSGHRRPGGRLGGAHDGRVAGAAAEVAGQDGVVIGIARHMRGGQRHHDPGRAAAALRAVVIHHRPLHRVQGAIGGGQPLDGGHRAPVHLRQEQDAGVQRHRPALVAQHHGAGAAIALVAAFLGAGQPAVGAQPVEQGGLRRHPVQIDALSVQQKGDLHDNVPPPYPVGPAGLSPMRRRGRLGFAVFLSKPARSGFGKHFLGAAAANARGRPAKGQGGSRASVPDPAARPGRARPRASGSPRTGQAGAAAVARPA